MTPDYDTSNLVDMATRGSVQADSPLLRGGGGGTSDGVNERVARLEARAEAVDQRLGRIEARIDSIDGSLADIKVTLAGLPTKSYFLTSLLAYVALGFAVVAIVVSAAAAIPGLVFSGIDYGAKQAQQTQPTAPAQPTIIFLPQGASVLQVTPPLAPGQPSPPVPKPSPSP